MLKISVLTTVKQIDWIKFPFYYISKINVLFFAFQVKIIQNNELQTMTFKIQI